jgi:RNA polymerase-binding transcription factor DksA
MATQRNSDQRPARSRRAARSVAQLARLDEGLKQLESGLHPVCAACGERIEMDRLRADPSALLCWSCLRRARRTR